jgi:hypothetical protein
MDVQELHIFPCTDTLLYAPVYLAIDTLPDTGSRYLLEKGGYVHDPTTDVCTWKYNDGLHVHLHPPSGGDTKAIGCLLQFSQQNQAQCVAIADPMTAIKAGSNLKVVGTFIDRMALSCLYMMPRPQHPPPYRKHLVNLCKHVAQAGRLLGGEFDGFASHINVAFCEQGATNKYLAKHFLGLNKSACPVADFGEEELCALENTDTEVHVSITSAPWLRVACDNLLEDVSLGDRICVGHWLPLIPYPFSAIITTSDCWKREQGAEWTGPIAIFLRHMVVAIALLQRYRDRVAHGLVTRAPRFRNFGVPKKALGKCEEIIKEAVRHLVDGDYLAEDLRACWLAWDFANETRRSANGLCWQIARTSYVGATDLDLEIAGKEGKKKDKGFWRTLWDNESFWKNDFRNGLDAYMNSDRLTDKWRVPPYSD